MELMKEAVSVASVFKADIDAGDFATNEEAERDLQERVSCYIDTEPTDFHIRVLREAQSPCQGWYELGEGVADFGTLMKPKSDFPFDGFAASAFMHEVKLALKELDVDLNNMIGEQPEAEQLASTVDTPEMDARVNAAFEASKYFARWGEDARFTTVFEHGQWWVKLYPNDVGERDEITYSVADAGGDSSVDGFDFEEV